MVEIPGFPGQPDRTFLSGNDPAVASPRLLSEGSDRLVEVRPRSTSTASKKMRKRR